MNSQGYKVELVKPEDSDVIMNLLQRTFFIDEPMNKALGLCDSGSCPELEDYCRKTLVDSLSVKAVDAEGNIVGVVVSGIATLNEDSAQDLISAAESCKNEKFKKILYVLSRREEGHKLCEKYPEEKKLFDVKLAATDPGWRNKGIMKVLLERTEQMVKQKRIRLLRMDTSSAFSAYCAERNGFTCIYSAKYADIKMNGEPLVVPEPPHIDDRVYIKEQMVKQKRIRLLRMDTSSAFSAYCAERNGFTCIYSAKYADIKMNGEPLVVPEPPHIDDRVYIKELF